MGSIVLYMYMSEKTDRVIWQVTDTRGVPILGRTQAKLMNYISYQEIHAPLGQGQSPVSVDSLQSAKTVQSTDSLKTTPTTDQTAQEEHRASTRAKSSTEHGPKSAQVSWCKSSVSINGKTHPLPTTKEYILHEYADVFKVVGTLPGGPYHIKLKRLVQTSPALTQVSTIGNAVCLQSRIRLVKEGIITEVHEHTEWINSMVPVMKEDGSLRLCLDPKDLNKAIKRNQWYARTLDDIPPELAQSKYFIVKDATSGFWHILLNFRSSLLTTFNTPWGKHRWLRMPFGLKVSGDVFQERLDRVLRLVPWVLKIADDIVIHGATQNTHDGTVLVLCETARLNYLSLNSKKMQFKSTDCKFFRHRLTLDGIKVDPKKIEAIIQMDPPHNVASLVFQWNAKLPKEIQPSLI